MHFSAKKQNRCANRYGYGFIDSESEAILGCFGIQFRGTFVKTLRDVYRNDMKRSRLQIYYSGRVQGVGFRYTVKSVVPGFEVLGTIRNLADGRVELVAEGSKDELEAFRQAIRESGLGALISQEQIAWGEAANEFRGFEIVG